MQRKLEFEFRLSRMPGARQATGHGVAMPVEWGFMRQETRDACNACMTCRRSASASKLVHLDPSVQAADPEVTYAMLKKEAALASTSLRRTQAPTLRSTVKRYLHSHRHFPQQTAAVSCGTHDGRYAQVIKLLFKTGFAPVRHQHAPKYKNAADRAMVRRVHRSCPLCPLCPCEDETAAHFALKFRSLLSGAPPCKQR
jgi:hypothetical protein